MGAVEVTLIVFIALMAALGASSLAVGLRRRGDADDAAES